MSVLLHYSVSKPQGQCAARDSSLVTTFFLLIFFTGRDKCKAANARRSLCFENREIKKS